jgi:hypothetical protein
MDAMVPVAVGLGVVLVVGALWRRGRRRRYPRIEHGAFDGVEGFQRAMDAIAPPPSTDQTDGGATEN